MFCVGMDKAFTKGLLLIEALARSDAARGISSLAADLELTKSNVHRLLSTLVAHDYVRQQETNSAYLLGPKLWELGALVMSRLDVAKVAHGSMAALATATGESVHLSILDGPEVIYIDKIDGLHAVRAYSRIGGRAPAWCVATGKAMLAFAPPEVVRAVEPHLSQFTDATVADMDALRAELQRIRTQRYAINRGEWRKDVCGIAVPVYDTSRRVIAAVGISGPAARLKTRQIKVFAAEVMKAGEAISAALGFRPDGLD